MRENGHAADLDTRTWTRVQSPIHFACDRWADAWANSNRTRPCFPTPEGRDSSMATLATTSSVQQRSRGRGYFWAGISVCLLGLAVAVAQFGLKILAVPWYSPVLATLGAFLLVVAAARRRTVPRVLALVLVAACAGLQWYVLVAMMK